MSLFSLPGPHDVPFAAPLMTAAALAFTIGFAILKLMDKAIDPAAHSSPNPPERDADQ